ncbi:hypothetical protein LacP0734_09475 [Lacticaseibacillus paracasei subsp. tolerans]|uniref:hypothetical protein n=1 Tax=Lacticaseibacillus paracasei TaxID=1597 RepID=UPI00189298BB|nr:hypothetical protein [Lacticaseibacillus paracasei]QPC17891.1 hypothetical protein LacP0734_09475 [Lacticaseibacillus paracasei subsp. tolerans]
MFDNAKIFDKSMVLSDQKLSRFTAGDCRDYNFGYEIGKGVRNAGKFIWYGLTGWPHYVS